jgi:hypothetical protein
MLKYKQILNLRKWEKNAFIIHTPKNDMKIRSNQILNKGLCCLFVQQASEMIQHRSEVQYMRETE